MSSELNWKAICNASELTPLIGVRALFEGYQVALFKIKDQLFAVDAIDPFTKTAVLSRGIVGDLQGQTVVASPIYKQHFNLETGACLEDESVSVKTFPVRENEGVIELALA